MNTPITQAHQSKPAYIYVRQSTLAQVRHNQAAGARGHAPHDRPVAARGPGQ